MIEQQIQALVDLGYSLADATRMVSAAAGLVPVDGDLATYVPTAEQLEQTVTTTDGDRARGQWYATAPNEFARLLDAPIQE